MKKQRYSELTFNHICKSAFGAATRIIWNGKVVYEDQGDALVIDDMILDPYKDSIKKALLNFNKKYKPKKVYSFYCQVVNFHHVELYIEGE